MHHTRCLIHDALLCSSQAAGPSRLRTYKSIARTPLTRPITHSSVLSQTFFKRGVSTQLKDREQPTSFYARSFPPHPTPSGVLPSQSTEDATEVEEEGDEAESSGQAGMKMGKKERYLDSLMDRAGELSLRCSILDADGVWTAEEGRYKKSELCKEYDLDPRDLRKLDSLSPNLVPLILSRRKCILVSILHIRALIKPDRVIIFDTAGTVESDVQKRFKWHLERNIKAGLKAGEEGDDQTFLDYEHRALESILVATANALEEEMSFTRRLVQQLLADLEGDINRDNLKRLLHYSRRMVGFQSRARYVKRAVDEILESDEDMSAMYLTSRARGYPRAVHDHEQLELLLESFAKQVEEIVSEVDTTVANMQSTQEIAELMLDSGRNALLALDVKISIATLGIGSGALLAGVFGMNLNTQIESHPYAFYFVTGSASLLAFFIFLGGMRVMRKVRRVALSDSSIPSYDRLIAARALHEARTTLGDQPSTGMMPKLNMTNAALWSRLFRRRVLQARDKLRGTEPVWINKRADLARARDASRYQEMQQQAAQQASQQAQRSAQQGAQRSAHRDAWGKHWQDDCDTDGWKGKWGAKGSRWAKQHF